MNANIENILTVDPERTEGRMMFDELCQLLDSVESTTKRLAIIEKLADFFHQIMLNKAMTINEQSAEIVRVIYLCSGRVSHTPIL
jgi:DNA ligase-like protein